jgi:putative membrane protein
MLQPLLAKNDRKYRILILVFSFIVFALIVLLGRYKLDAKLDFDVHVFASINAVINSIVSVLLLAGLIAVRNGKLALHRNIMFIAMGLSFLFLLSYIAHHLLSGDTAYGGVGSIRLVYYFILITHIILAAIILPFILFTTYRALVGEYARHKKLARVTWPIWFYVSVSGVIVYLMISPFYS